MSRQTTADAALSPLDSHGTIYFSTVEAVFHMMAGYGLVFSSFPDPTSSSAGTPVHPAGSVEVHIPNHIKHAQPVRDRILQELQKAGYDESSRFGIQLAFDEAITNAVIHGNRKRENAKLRIAYCITPEAVYLFVGDEGEGFDPDAIEDPTLDENIDRPTGRGLFLMRAYMTSIEYNGKGTAVRMIHCRNPEKGPPSEWIANTNSS